MSVFRRTRTAAICAVASAALVVGMAGTAIAFSDSSCGWAVACDGLALHGSSPVPTTPRTASTPTVPTTAATAAVATARTPAP